MPGQPKTKYRRVAELDERLDYLEDQFCKLCPKMYLHRQPINDPLGRLWQHAGIAISSANDAVSNLKAALHERANRGITAAKEMAENLCELHDEMNGETPES
jgi:hypothetical protein